MARRQASFVLGVSQSVGKSRPYDIGFGEQAPIFEMPSGADAKDATNLSYVGAASWAAAIFSRPSCISDTLDEDLTDQALRLGVPAFLWRIPGRTVWPR